MEAEYIAAATTAKEVIWMRRMLAGLTDIKYTSIPTTLNIDNNGARDLAMNESMNSQRTKHIDVRYHFIRDCIKNKEINIIPCSSDQNTADIFTKGLSRETFERHRTNLGIGYIHRDLSLQ